MSASRRGAARAASRSSEVRSAACGCIVNHAHPLEHGGPPGQRSVAVRHAFNDGWDLVCKSALDASEHSQVDYLWYSHEHPDHFSPRVLQDVPKERRSAITVLYRATRDGKVLGFCKQLGFATRELPDGEPVELAGGIRVTCQSVPLFDSWLLVEAGGRRVLNLNDCVLQTPSELARLHAKVGALDALFTQFSYAAWRGNRADTELRRADAKKKLDIVRAQVRALAPAATFPFASFVLRARGERVHQRRVNHPWEVLEPIEAAGSRPIRCTRATTGSWRAARQRERRRPLPRVTTALPGRPLHRSAPVPFGRARGGARGYVERIRAANSGWLLDLLRVNPIRRPAAARHPALGPGDRVRSRSSGAREIAERDPAYDLRMGSDSLAFVFSRPGDRHPHRERPLPRGSRGPEAPGPDLRGRHAEQHRSGSAGVPGRFRVDQLPLRVLAGSSPACGPGGGSRGLTATRPRPYTLPRMRLPRCSPPPSPRAPAARSAGTTCSFRPRARSRTRFRRAASPAGRSSTSSSTTGCAPACSGRRCSAIPAAASRRPALVRWKDYRDKNHKAVGGHAKTLVKFQDPEDMRQTGYLMVVNADR
jgi:hypothetical protein